MRIFVVDAFTDEAFRGNPAGVCFLDRPAADSELQAIAAEMNLPETAFVSEVQGGLGLRWFTPQVEVDLCGHATLASAIALWRSGRQQGPLAFATRSGTLVARPYGQGVELDFPSLLPEPIDCPSELAGALGARPVAVAKSRFDWLVELESAEAVRTLAPDIAEVRALPARGVIVTAASDEDSIDFVSRFFAPKVGIDEDPVTGSAHCVLAPYWAARVGRDELVGYQASRRGGRVEVALAGERVLLRGEGVIVLAGELFPSEELLSSGGGWGRRSTRG